MPKNNTGRKYRTETTAIKAMNQNVFSEAIWSDKFINTAGTQEAYDNTGDEHEWDGNDEREAKGVYIENNTTAYALITEKTWCGAYVE